MLDQTDTLETLLQLPATIAIESPADVTGPPENCEPASWAYVEVDDAIAYRAAAEVLADHADELQAVMVRMYEADQTAIADRY